MDSDFCKKLAGALGIEPVAQPCQVQKLFNRYKKHMDGKIIESPLPEQVHLLAENWPYWIKLENPNPANLAEWSSAKSNIVVPMLEANMFDQTGFKFDENRAKELPNVPTLLERPNCIHRNLRNHPCRGHGGIKGDYMYVSYHGKKVRKVAFTIMDPSLGKIVLVTSFWTHKQWVKDCAEIPPVYVREGCVCTCQ